MSLSNFAVTQGGGAGTVTTTTILDATIANADVASDAAIDASKTTAVPLSGGTMTGTLQMADQIVQRSEIKDYSETYNASSGSGTVDLDLETGNVFQHTVSGGNVTFTFSNPPASGKAGSFTLKWIQDSSDRTITWPGAVDWAGGSAPDVTSGSGKVDMYTFVTVDAGTTWYGFQAGADLS